MSYNGYTNLPLYRSVVQDFEVTVDLQNLFGFGESYSHEDFLLKYIPMVDLLADASKQTKPYVIGVAGSVAVGKSTTSRVIKYLLESQHNLKVALVPTDGFLYSNKYLERHNLEERKGFPESYDMKKLLQFLLDLKKGQKNLQAPCYCHHVYDILQDKHINVDGADIVIIEGLNVLQDGKCPQKTVSNFIDFGIYIDAGTSHISNWFIKRFMMYLEKSRNDSSAYFYNFRNFSDKEAVRYATAIWKNINLINLNMNILPSRENADLIVAKDSTHGITNIYIKG